MPRAFSIARREQTIYHMNLKLITAQAGVSLGLAWQLHAAPPTILPGAVWPDDRGQHVQAHGGGVI